MRKHETKLNNNLIRIIITSIMIIFVSATIIMASETDANCITPTDDQYFELRAVEVKEVQGQNKQVIMELWGNNIEFKGFDVRFSYDITKLQPSNITTNEITDDETAYFQFEDEFKTCLEFFTITYDATGDGIRGILAFNPPVTESEHIIDKDGIGKVINTDGGVLLGKMSFQMTADVFDAGWFSLVENSENYPTTGIKINIDGTNNYQAQSTFRFTDRTASKDASLSDLVLSTGQVDETNPGNSTYKEYALTPNFNKDTLDYELTLLEYIDEMSIKATQNDSKSTMKVKVPKRDADNNLMYESNGTTIIYEEKVIQNNTPLEFVLNKLGEPDTNITVIVTAEDGVTTSEYNVVIKRPYGTIKGQLLTYNTDDIHIGTIKVYKAGEITWEDYYISHNALYTHDDLPEPIDYVESEEDGTFSIKVIPGKYDIMIDKDCYFDNIIKHQEILESETKDLSTIELKPGDINKDGMIDAKDFNSIKLYFGQDYPEADVDESGTIDAPDFNAVKLRFGQSIEIY